VNKDLAKIKLVYEFNNNSPLFARVAEAELNEGNADKALQILENGLKNYPNYTSAHLVYIEALAKKGEYQGVVEKFLLG
jgi:tetratricopeptide (TPR) repeat protein